MTTAQATDQLREFIDAIFEPTDLVELRLIRTSPKDTKQSWRIASEIPERINGLQQLNERGYNVYLGVNPRRETGGASNTDVALARCLVVDFDGVALAEVRRRIDEASLPAPTLVLNSGHGHHCYWRLDEPLHDLSEWRSRQQGLIDALDSDRSIKDAARIMRVPGFLNVKGDPVACDLVECDAARQYPIDEFPRSVPRPGRTTQPIGKASSRERENALRYLGQLKPERADPRESWLQVGMTLHSVDQSDSMLVEWDRWSRLSSKWEDGACAEQWATFKANGALTIATLHGMANEDDPPKVRTSTAPNKPQDGFNLTELGNARRLVNQHGCDLLYCDPWARWLVWDGKRWKADEGRRIETLAVDTLKSIYAEAADEPNTARRKSVADWAQRCETAHHVKQIIALARHRVPVVPDQLDTDPWKFNVLNGTLDLRNSELRPHDRADFITKLRPHDRADFITKLAPVEYDADAECPRWEQFLSVVLAGNEELIGFLQRMAGYSLTGDISERCLFILYGGGCNGKTTFIETLRGVLGDYALRTPAETLLARRGDTIPNDVARLKGARLVTASETEDNRRFAEAFVKDLTGGDTITARFMRAEYFEFRPECKIVLATNHRPVVRGTDDAIWARLRLVPFTVTIPEQDRDPHLRGKLIAESAGILAWAVRGCLAWQRSGLGSPAKVAAATEAYRSDMDVLGAFLDDCCELRADAVTPAAGLYERYKRWADQSGERPMTQRTFGLRLKERGLDNSGRMPGTRRKAWSGISLTNEFGVEREP